MLLNGKKSGIHQGQKTQQEDIFIKTRVFDFMERKPNFPTMHSTISFKNIAII